MSVKRPLPPVLVDPLGKPLSGGELPWEAEGGGAPFTPAKLPGLGLWLRSDNVVTSGASVTTWTDLSGNGNDASGGTSPSYNTTDAALNNQPTVEFNGSTEYLVVTDDATIRLTGNGYEVHVVGRWTSSVSNEDFLAKADAAVSWLLRKTNGDVLRMLVRNAADTAFYDNSDTTPTLGDGTSRLATLRYNGSNSCTVAVDNSAGASDTDTGHKTETENLGIGARASGAQFAACALAEIVIYQRELSAAERAKLVAYFEGRYGGF